MINWNYEEMLFNKAVIFQWLSTLFCCACSGLRPIYFTHNVQDYSTCPVAIVRLPQWSNTEGYG